jgi:hypothetical protein
MLNILMINGVGFKDDSLMNRRSLAYPVADDGSFERTVGKQPRPVLH